MWAEPLPTGRSLALAATLVAAILALLATLGTLAFLLVAPGLGSLELGGGGGDPGPSIPTPGSAVGFSLLDAVVTLLVGVSVLLWAWVILDLLLVVRPLGRGDLLGAEAPALLLGLLQLVAGGVLPGLLLLMASRTARHAIGRSPALEVARSAAGPRPDPLRYPRARQLGRIAMIGFGLLWGIAGASMFQNQFYLYLPRLIQAASTGSPAFLSGWFHFWAFVSSLGGLPAAYLAGTVQLALAFALIAGFARKVAYFGGLLAAVFLWIVPEAFGGPFVAGAFSLGPGVVYALGLVALIALNATYGPDLGTLDAAIARRFPRWSRLAEVSVGLVPPIGRWYLRHAGGLARAVEVAVGVVLAASATVAWAYDWAHSLGATLVARGGTADPLSGWTTFWARAAPTVGTPLAVGIIGVEYLLAAGALLGIARRAVGVIGLVLAGIVWVVVEAFGGWPGPGYTDPGVGIAEAFVFVGFLALAAARAAGAGPVTRRLVRWRSDGSETPTPGET